MPPFLRNRSPASPPRSLGRLLAGAFFDPPLSGTGKLHQPTGSDTLSLRRTDWGPLPREAQLVRPPGRRMPRLPATSPEKRTKRYRHGSDWSAPVMLPAAGCRWGDAGAWHTRQTKTGRGFAVTAAAKTACLASPSTASGRLKPLGSAWRRSWRLRMPLTLRPTLGAGIDQDRPDYTLYWGGWAVGRIYGAIIALATGQGGDDNVFRYGRECIRSLSPHNLSGKKKPRRAGPSGKSEHCLIRALPTACPVAIAIAIALPLPLLPLPLLPLPLPFLPEEAAIAVEFSDVESRSVIVGGVTTANLPQEARNFRRSSSALTSSFLSAELISWPPGRSKLMDAIFASCHFGRQS